MYKTNEIFEQKPPPHFYLKVVCKKGEGVCVCVFGRGGEGGGGILMVII